MDSLPLSQMGSSVDCICPSWTHLRGMSVYGKASKQASKVTQSCLTLCNPMGFFLSVIVPQSLTEGSFSPSLMIWGSCSFGFEALVTLQDNGSSSALMRPCRVQVCSPGCIVHRLSREATEWTLGCTDMWKGGKSTRWLFQRAMVPVLGNHPDLWPPCLCTISPIYSFIYTLAHRKIFSQQSLRPLAWLVLQLLFLHCFCDMDEYF